MNQKEEIADGIHDLLARGFVVILHGYKDDYGMRISASAGHDQTRRHYDGTSLFDIVHHLNGTEQEKLCSKCGKDKPHSHFHKHPTHKDRLDNMCNQCRRKAVKSYKGKRREKINGSPVIPAIVIEVASGRAKRGRSRGPSQPTV